MRFYCYIFVTVVLRRKVYLLIFYVYFCLFGISISLFNWLHILHGAQVRIVILREAQST